MTRRFGEAARHGIRYSPRAGVYAILPRDGRVLVTLQAEPVPELQLPGGGIDPGESPLHALFREVREETGWTIARPCRLGTFRRFTFLPDYDLWAEKICTIYLAHPVRKRGAPSEPGHRALWISAEHAMRELGNAGDRHFVSRVARRL